MKLKKFLVTNKNQNRCHTRTSCSALDGGHPTCFLHWDILKKDMKTNCWKRGTVPVPYVNALVARRSTSHRFTLASASHTISDFSSVSSCSRTSSFCTNAKTFRRIRLQRPLLSGPDSAKGCSLPRSFSSFCLKWANILCENICSCLNAECVILWSYILRSLTIYSKALGQKTKQNRRLSCLHSG